MHASTREAAPAPVPVPTPTPTFVPKATSQLKAQAPTFQPSKPSTYLRILMRYNLHPTNLSSQNKELKLTLKPQPHQTNQNFTERQCQNTNNLSPYLPACLSQLQKLELKSSNQSLI